MKVAHHLARLEPIVLHPLHGIDDASWHRAPRRKWTIAQIVQHLAIGIDAVGRGFVDLADASESSRISKPHQSVLRHLVLGLGQYPGALRAMPDAKPDDRPDADLIVAQFRMGVEQLRELTETWPRERQLTRFITHAVLGDLNVPEWVRFHYLHCRHYGQDIGRRLRWLSR
ncbi:MAG: DinB family protein [Gemmatimonadota bacterium]|nr:DinB family protein [Gemmatimonadota bacterium]MDH3367634.1 DinB family protein [Gemmatimonadota bacterium]MDH3478419.1 DinB family protein [Gemmatimonadota bacterium]MDH3568760.1 DinB family protein [Gemmatimonadota bacterium]MDH5549381.1 DinB family protein [Gemmatimonadota bacterium]